MGRFQIEVSRREDDWSAQARPLLADAALQTDIDTPEFGDAALQTGGGRDTPEFADAALQTQEDTPEFADAALQTTPDTPEFADAALQTFDTPEFAPRPE